MEENNEIELSLGLSFGGIAGKPKSKDASSSVINLEEGDSSNSLMGDLKSFLTAGIPAQDADNGLNKSDSVHSVARTPSENFFTDLGRSVSGEKSSLDLHGSRDPQLFKYGGLWDVDGKTVEAEEQKLEYHETGQKLGSEAGNKRKILFEEMTRQKKYEKENQDVDGSGKNLITGAGNVVKTTHGSETTGDAPPAAEDVAESEPEVSITKVVSHHGDVSRPYCGGGSSQTPYESRGFTTLNAIDFQGKTSYDVRPGNELEVRNLGFGVPFSMQPRMDVPYARKVDNTSNDAFSTSGFSSSSIMQLRPPVDNEGIANQVVIPAFLQTPVHGSSEVLLDESKATDLTKDSVRQHVIHEGGASSSSQMADWMKEYGVIFRSKEASQETAIEGFPLEGSAIRPGIAAGLKFGGCGSYPDLPWVSTTGPGPIISGVVTYQNDKNHIKIICACHGSHMSPEEFVQHATADQASPENQSGLATFSSSNPATSTRS